MSQNAETEEYEEPEANGLFARLKHFMRGGNDDEYEDNEAAEPHTQPHSVPSRASGGSLNPVRRTGTTLRMDQARRTHVTVRRAVHSFDDARNAADGLKEGQQQIVNLEQTPADMAERIIDFLNGATYALDGSVEKIGEQVYLFTPSSVIIDVEDKPATGARLFDRA